MKAPLTSGHWLALLIIVVGETAALVAYHFSKTASVLAAVTLCALLWLLRPLFMPPRYGEMKLRTLCVLGIFGLAASYGVWADLLNAAIRAASQSPAAQQVAPWLAEVQLGDAPSIAALIFVLTGLWLVLRGLDGSIAGASTSPMSEDFPQPTFQAELKAFCWALENHLNAVDSEENWSSSHYTDLEAEVEIVGTGGAPRERSLMGLQKAIRLDRGSNAFLLLGTPGSGKSVALRKLAGDMLREVEATERVPIYINLREWLAAQGPRWSETSPPTAQDVENFVTASLKARGDCFTHKFVDTYFRDMWRSGRLFFIFDSFDEIPELLDAREESWLIKALSQAFSLFICSHPQSRGVVAARTFRPPTAAFQAKKVLLIRPLTETRIVQAMARFPAFTPPLQAELFRSRQDLVAAIRTPLLMALLGEWVTIHRELPDTQVQLYESFLKDRLRQCAPKLAELGLTEQQVFDGAAEIAHFVFKSPTYGLEAPVHVIAEAFVDTDIDRIIEVLQHARIARVRVAYARSFAFVHRRFLEYLVCTKLLERPWEVGIEDVPTDARGRDALVLYAQICDEPEAEYLACQCWEEVCYHRDGDASSRLRAIHSLRFLIDAFQVRRAAIALFADDLAEYIHACVATGQDLVAAKICLETTGLLNGPAVLEVLKTAIQGGNSWLQETAFRACRQLPRLEPALERLLKRYVVTIPLRQFWLDSRGLLFSLSLSEPLRSAYRAAVWRRRNLIASMVAAPFALIVGPETIAMSALIAAAALHATQGKNGNELESSVTDEATAGQGTFLEAFRMLVAMFLVYFGAMICATEVYPTLYLLADGEQKESSRQMLGALTAVLGLMLLDWLQVVTWRRDDGALRRRGRLSWFRPSPLALILPLLLILLFWQRFFLFMSELLTKFGMLGLKIVAAGLLLGSLTLGRRVVGEYLHDRRAFAAIAFTSCMRRADIIAALDQLHTDHWRMKFLRQLDRQGIVAVEPWPESFQLRVTVDPVMTELARLEERWLGLGR
ncbi:NACHT domain-containing protein [Steroidobacter flavus]|uniref:NACHT domain-containing protein n=1 Tax=Steroidobacter flavus TaxID=1842136 RepID=A0ABV8T7H0_9GAMM